MGAEQDDFVSQDVVSPPRSINGLDANTDMVVTLDTTGPAFQVEDSAVEAGVYTLLDGNDIESERWDMLSGRDKAILTAREQGATLKDLVDQFGTSKQNLSVILHRRESFLHGGETGKQKRRFSLEVRHAVRDQRNSLDSNR